jgi:hypothetical protein
MRRAVGNAVRKEFGIQIVSHFSQFAQLRGHTVYPGDRLYAWTTAGATFFLRWVPHKSKDAFTVEYGWSSRAEPPTAHDWASDRDVNQLSRDGHYFRISQMAEPPRREHWWVLADDMRDAMEKTKAAFRQEGDTPIQTLARASSEAGIELTFANYRETPVGQIVPDIAPVVSDCMACISRNVMPFFLNIAELTRDKT